MITSITGNKLSFQIRLVSLILLSLIISKTGHCQEIIHNEISSKYHHVAGTKVKLVIPKDFKAVTTFKGLQNTNQTASISVLESSTPYSIYLERAIPAIIKNNTTQMVEKASYIINGIPAKLYKGTNKANNGVILNRMFLVFGTENQTIALNCHYAVGDSEIEARILDGILSVIYFPDETNNPYLNLGYSIDASNSNYSTISYSGSAITYSKPKKENIKPSTFVIMRRTIQKPVEDFESYIYDLIDLVNFKATKIVYSKSVTIDGLNGIEMLADLTGKNSGQNTQGYFISLFDSQYTYSLVGYYLDANAPEEMKKIFSTLKRD